MRVLPIWILLLCVALVPAASPSARAADDLQMMLEQAHPWARFGQGAWRHVRITTENFDESGKATDSSVADNKTTVVEVTPERVTLEVEVTVEVAGQRFPSQPQTVIQGYAGESLGEKVTFQPLDPETLTIDSREIRCESQQINIEGGVTREASQITFAAGSQPAILRRKSTLSDGSGQKQLQEMVTQVMSLGMARRVLREQTLRPAYLVRSSQSNDRGKTITWSWHVPEIPGEVVDQCSHKTDAAGRVIRRTTLELVGYGLSEVTEVETRDPQVTPESRRARRKQRRGN